MLLSFLAIATLLAADTPVTVPSIDIGKLLDLLLGPVGLTVGALFVIYQFTADRWLTSKRSDEQAAKIEKIWLDRYTEMKADRDVAVDLAQKAVTGYTSVTDAIKARNQSDAELLRSLQTESETEPGPQTPDPRKPGPGRGRR